MGYSYLCPKCGNIKYDVLEESDLCNYCGAKVEKISLTLNEVGTMSDSEKDTLRLSFQPKEKYDSFAWNQRIIKDNQLHNQAQQQTAQMNAAHPECPYCHSRNTRKISTASKAINTGLFGIFGTKRHKEFHCDNCKSDF